MSTTHTFPPTLRVGILVFDGFEPIDVWGPVEAFSIARFIGTSYSDDNPRPFETVFISTERRSRPDAVPAPVKSANGPRVAPDLFRNEAGGAELDILLIPGGLGVYTIMLSWSDEERESLLRWVKRLDSRVSIMASVCTGAAILAAAGVLDGEAAATNHQAFAWVSEHGPLVRWDNVARWVDAGRHVTSAGVSAGTDMAFYLVQRLCGRAVAEQACLAAEYAWTRDPSQPMEYPAGAAVPSSW